ncbi:60S acidic ribosomal protein, putative [Trypanosoma brucei brucei TREU927]|uniref:60S acidic ribosomal protein, putative n=2 Tax=Trypanosoma brucei TaxID=5691 RepID=Q57ZQ1_TRYB2|nr:60S acidic ribosomal protein, putative [Trypanosoma brucei brucei TREU927]AAX79115.1 60S acidic ribosomal protein, putative [Trypanosoma brucei]AAZ11297.1 60S acidic ribosomal protein, putative [Trypanosoma brucei brucei TREU927]RHW72408.1 60S acidic ribosomal protein [Trypanosoma brucei equiperdum]
MSQQLACTYASLILSGSGNVDAAKLLAVTNAAGVTVSKGMAEAFASILGGISIDEVLGNIAFGGGAPVASSGGAAAAAPAAGGAPAAAAPAKEEEEDDDDMGFGLFD